MKQGSGKVSRIFHNETKAGKPYWVVAIQTAPNKYERLSTFDFNTLSGLSEGDTISYKADQNGKYTNILEIVKTTMPGTDPMKEYQAGGGIAEIGRMSALKYASQLLVDYKGEPDEKVRRALAAAKEFEAYIFGMAPGKSGEADSPGSKAS